MLSARCRPDSSKSAAQLSKSIATLCKSQRLLNADSSYGPALALVLKVTSFNHAILGALKGTGFSPYDQAGRRYGL